MNNKQKTLREETPTQRVINYATQEFYAQGVRQVTMDSIAKGLQMSKRTLYQLFTDKEELIIACIENIAEHEARLKEELTQKGLNVLEVFLCITEHRLRALEKASLQYLLDIKRYKNVTNHIHAMQEQTIERSLQFFLKGIEQQLFREDINFKILIKSLFFTVHNISTKSIITEYSIDECFINVVLFHIRGCCTEKGIKIIDNFLDYYRKQHTTA